MLVALLGLVCLGGFLGLDRTIAESLSRSHEWPGWALGTEWIETLFGFQISKWATGLALLLGAGALFLLRRRHLAAVLGFIGIVQLTTRLVVGLMKVLLPRHRPFEVLASGAWDSQWFQDQGSSFPSGHAAHFWGLLFPLAVLYPRLALWFLPLPLFVSAARVAVNDHYLSDVAASAAIAALITLIAYRATRRKPRRSLPGAAAGVE